MWFNNHSRTKKANSDLLTLSASVRKKKILPAYQAYQLLYGSKIDAVLSEEWKAKWEADHSDDETAQAKPPPPPIHVRNAVAIRLLKEETEKVKAEVEEYRKKEGSDHEDKCGDGETTSLERAQAYQR